MVALGKGNSRTEAEEEAAARWESEKEAEIDYVFKVVVVGDSAVGKTQLLARFEAMTEVLGGIDNVAMIDPLDYPNFVRLLSLCHFVMTDSGGVQEEAPALAKPVLVMRETTERPEGVAAGTAKLVGNDEEVIVTEASRLLDDKAAYEAMARAHNPFGDGKSSERIARIILDSAA